MKLDLRREIAEMVEMAEYIKRHLGKDWTKYLFMEETFESLKKISDAIFTFIKIPGFIERNRKELKSMNDAFIAITKREALYYDLPFELKPEVIRKLKEKGLWE